MSKTKLIEFDYQKYLDGYKAVFRNCKHEILLIWKSPLQEEYPILVIRKCLNASIYEHYTPFGKLHIDGKDRYLDLMLEVPAEEETFCIQINANDGIRLLYNSIEKCQKNIDEYSYTNEGLLKVTYAEKDSTI